MIPVLVVLMLPIAALGVLLMAQRRRTPVRVWTGPRRSGFILPPARETAASVRRFHLAVERWRNVELICERFRRL